MLLVAALLTASFTPPPRCQISMMARRDPVVPRRDIGKAFAEAGGGEAMTGLIAIAGISFGAQYRQGVEDSSEALMGQIMLATTDFDVFMLMMKESRRQYDVKERSRHK